MSRFGCNRPTVTIEALTGGFVLDWDKPVDRPQVNQSSLWEAAEPENTSGREVFTDLKSAMKRAKALLS